ncbi:unnamed protein product [Paramecium octaurelia]|uniref:Uncharacterized protein n=1 Tax=Paramecium octaurelia TaxID=43137 RepID=A0A8S1YD09_PAROT|nr:unnamed protein product [Paramecium octaurelia]
MGNTCCLQQNQEENIEINAGYNNAEGRELNTDHFSAQEIQDILTKFETNLSRFIHSSQDRPQPINIQSNPHVRTRNYPTGIDDHTDNLNFHVDNIIKKGNRIMEFAKGNNLSNIQVIQINQFADELEISAIKIDNLASEINQFNQIVLKESNKSSISRQLHSHILIQGPQNLTFSNASSKENQSDQLISTSHLTAVAQH